MCAALELDGKSLRPGGLVCAWTAAGGMRFVWAGFARKESLGWWKRNGAELVDVPATRFAERSDRTRELNWDEVPSGLVARGIVDKTGATPLLKVVTRQGTAEELARFEHDRMPLLEPPLFSAEPVPEETLPPVPAARARRKPREDDTQGMLF